MILTYFKSRKLLIYLTTRIKDTEMLSSSRYLLISFLSSSIDLLSSLKLYLSIILDIFFVDRDTYRILEAIKMKFVSIY